MLGAVEDQAFVFGTRKGNIFFNFSDIHQSIQRLLSICEGAYR